MSWPTAVFASMCVIAVAGVLIALIVSGEGEIELRGEKDDEL